MWVAVTTISMCEWVKFRECDELLFGWRFPLRLNGAVFGELRKASSTVCK